MRWYVFSFILVLSTCKKSAEEPTPVGAATGNPTPMAFAPKGKPASDGAIAIDSAEITWDPDQEGLEGKNISIARDGLEFSVQVTDENGDIKDTTAIATVTFQNIGLTEFDRGLLQLVNQQTGQVIGTNCDRGADTLTVQLVLATGTYRIVSTTDVVQGLLNQLPSATTAAQSSALELAYPPVAVSGKVITGSTWNLYAPNVCPLPEATSQYEMETVAVASSPDDAQTTKVTMTWEVPKRTVSGDWRLLILAPDNTYSVSTIPLIYRASTDLSKLVLKAIDVPVGRLVALTWDFQAIPDTQAPEPGLPAILVDSGAPITTDANVNLTLSASDAFEMFVSQTTDCTLGHWEGYAAEKIWNIGAATGTITMSVKFRDMASNESACSTATIKSVAAPQMISLSRASGSKRYTNQPASSFSVSFNGLIVHPNFIQVTNTGTAPGSFSGSCSDDLVKTSCSLTFTATGVGTIRPSFTGMTIIDRSASSNIIAALTYPSNETIYYSSGEANIRFHYDARDTNSFTFTGAASDRISEWANKESDTNFRAVRITPTAEKGPKLVSNAINGYAGVSFPFTTLETDECLSTFATLPDESFTLFVLANWQDMTTNQILVGVDPSIHTQIGIFLEDGDPGAAVSRQFQSFMRSHSGAPQHSTNHHTLASAGVRLIVLQRSKAGRSYSSWINDVPFSDPEQVLLNSSPGIKTNDAGSWSLVRLRLGCRAGNQGPANSAPVPFKGYLGEVYYFSEALDDAKRSAFSSNLIERWAPLAP